MKKKIVKKAVEKKAKHRCKFKYDFVTRKSIFPFNPAQIFVAKVCVECGSIIGIDLGKIKYPKISKFIEAIYKAFPKEEKVKLCK